MSKKAFSRPFESFRKYIIGTLLLIVPIVNFLVYGYVIECMRMTFRKKYGMPEWKSWGKLFLDGVLVFAIQICYALIFIVLIGPVVIMTLSGLLTKTVPLAILSFLIILAGILLFSLLTTGAMANFARKKKFAAGFEIRTIFRKVFTKKFIWAVFLSIIYAIGVSIIVQFLPIKNIEILLILLVNFPITVTVYTLWAEAW